MMTIKLEDLTDKPLDKCEGEKPAENKAECKADSDGDATDAADDKALRSGSSADEV